MEIEAMQIVVAIATVLIALCIQTITIGYFIGGIKVVVVRLVKDVEGIGVKISLAVEDLIVAKKDIQELVKCQGKNEVKIEVIESKLIFIEEHLDIRDKRN